MLEYLELPCLAINEIAVIRYYSDLEITNTNLNPNFEFDNLSSILISSLEAVILFISSILLEIASVAKEVWLFKFLFILRLQNLITA